MCIRATVRNTGPIPLSKLTPLLPDEFMEVLNEEGFGLAAFIERNPNYLVSVPLPGHVIIAISNNYLKQAHDVDQRKLACWVMALLSAAHFLPGQPQVVALGLSSPHPTIEELSFALRHWTSISPVRLEVFLRSLPDLFAVISQTRRARLLIVHSITPNEDTIRSIAGGLAPLLVKAKPQGASKFAVWLRTVVPSQFHVPVSFIIDKAREMNVMDVTFGTATPTLNQVKGQFQRLPAGFADIRAFGDAPHTVFVRVIDPEPLLLESGVPSYSSNSTPPELEAERYNPTRLAHELTEAIEHYAAQSAMTRARVTKGVEMSRLRDYVPAALMRKLESFYGFSPKDDPRVCILLLDRLRHLWEVQLSAGVARPWAYLPESEMPSSLTLQTSPSPRVLLHCQRLLVECGGQPLVDLYNVLPADLKTAFMDLYGSPAEASAVDAVKALPTEATDAAAAQPAVADTPLAADDGRVVKAVEAFVRTHTLFFFEKDGRVYTSRRTPEENSHLSPLLAEERAETRRRHAVMQKENAALPTPAGSDNRCAPASRDVSLTDSAIANVVYNTIPKDSWILVDSLRGFLFVPRRRQALKRRSGLYTETFRREFFERHHRLFNIHFLFGYDKLVVSRAGYVVKETNLLSPRIDNVARLIKLMALFSVDSISDTSITRRLPPEGRMLVRSLGSVVDVAEQLPMWFAVQRDEINFGSSLIRYIGPLAKTERSPYALKPHPTGVLTRKVPNDPFADIGPDEAEGNGGVDEWNEDWNEEGDVLSNANKWGDDDDDDDDGDDDDGDDDDVINHSSSSSSTSSKA